MWSKEFVRRYFLRRQIYIYIEART